MAAMAPALTDAPAEAHHMRFKLAPPSSTLSPGSVENNSNASNILVTSNGAVKCRPPLPASEECPRDYCGGGKKEEPSHGETLGKLQPLVTSYLCSDVTSVASTKDSLKIQGVLIKQSVLKSHAILPSSYFTGDDFLPRKQQPLECPGEQLKEPVGPPVPVNGLTRKLATPSIEQDGASLVNGGGPPVSPDTPPQSTTEAQEGHSHRGGIEQQPRNVPLGDGSEQADPPLPTSDLSPERPAGSPSKRQPSLATGERGAASGGHATPNTSPSSLRVLDLEVSDRTLLSQSRQNEIKSRLHRLRKRLQVVQAKQVERHIQQQLGGFLQMAMARPPGQRHRSHGPRWLGGEQSMADGLSSFLKNSRVAAEIERFSLSGSTLLRAAEDAFDSDVTESSSGGETDVEEEELAKVDVEQRHVPLWRRAEGRYALERASIISHWNWLQAQVSDLEYRIRQQTDIYRQIRASKGMVTLGDTLSCDLSVEGGLKSDPVTGQATRVPGSSGAEFPGLGHSPLSKVCVSERPVNGMVNSMQSALLDCGSPESSDAEELFSKKPGLLPPAASTDVTCVAARTRPVISCRKRRLVRSAACLGHKVQRPSRYDGSCSVSPLCVMCGGYISPFAEFPYRLPLLERLSHFEPCIHPILSFSDDVSMNLHLQRVMKSHWQKKPLEKTKPLKKLSLKHKLPPSCRLPESPSFSKDKHKTTSLLNPTVRLSHHKVRPEKLHRQHLDSFLRGPKQDSRPSCKAERSQAFSHAAYERNHGRKRPRENSLDRVEAAPRLFMDSGSPCSSLASLHSPLVRQFSASVEGPTAFALSQSASSTPPIRRRRGESSFDINNIVIPMSVAATTRVEKLQYKEILTPSWRKVDMSTQRITEEDDTVEMEDLSDAAFTQLHQQYEVQERSRWTWTASATAKRRGSRSYKSVDGRTTPLLGSANPATPQPSSPDTAHFHALPDYGPVASPCSPASPDLLSNPHTPSSRDGQRLQSSEDTRCSTPDFTFEEQPVQPWERRTFPLERDPDVEPEEQDCLIDGQPCRGLRRILTCKTSSSKSESDNDPPSPFQDDKCPGQLRFGHR